MDWLIRGEAPMQREPARLADRTAGELVGHVRRVRIGEEPVVYRDDELPEGFVLVPRYDVEASAGPGALTGEENIVDFMAFQETWVRRALRADPRRLALVTAVGDSMEPTIRAGDLLLVDTSFDKVMDDAIYVIGIDDALMVKRLQRFFTGAVSVKSDNPAYVEQSLPPEDNGPSRIAGRVRWIGRLI